MKFFPVVLISTAVAVTACTGTATVSGLSVGSVTRSVHPNAAPNADQDTSDLGNRPNPPIHKAAGKAPIVLAPASPVITTRPTVPTSTVRDRCSNETGRPGKPQPMCLPA